MVNERREEKRKRVSIEAQWEGMSGRHNARITDISLGGCFLETLGHAALGEVIVFEIKIPGGKWLQLRGEVISYDPNIGFGLSFTYLTEEEENLLTRLVKR